MYFLGKWGTSQASRPSKAKIDRHLVAELRRYVRQEGFGLKSAEQIRRLQATTYGYGLSKETIREILKNQSWYDPAYVPGEPDESYWGQIVGGVSLMALRVLAR